MSPIHWILFVPLLGLLACAGDDARPDGDTADAEVETSAPDAPDTTDTSGPDEVDGADGSGAPSTWEERFEAVIPSEGVVPVRLEFEPGVWREILESWLLRGEKVERRAVIASGPLAHPAVGVRLKGLSSLVFPNGLDLGGKYPLKLDFNSQGGERLHGVDELGLNSSIHDPSFVRDWLAARMFREMDVAAAKVGFADVTISAPEAATDESADYHIGLQPLVQVIDKRFLKHAFGEDNNADDGNLYKCTYNQFSACSLAWLGDSPSDYVRATGCAADDEVCGLILQTNEDDPSKNDYADVLHLIETLAIADETERVAKLPLVFDVDHFLRLAAVNTAIGNHDSYFGRGHNHYLYRRADGRFQMIPWDFDLSYARGCEAGFEYPTCGEPTNHPLVAQIWSVDAWRLAYEGYLCELGTTLMTPEVQGGWIEALFERLEDHVAADENAVLEVFRAELALDGGVLMEFVAEQQAMLLGACAR